VLGNILTKSDYRPETYQYGSSRPHAVTSVGHRTNKEAFRQLLAPEPCRWYLGGALNALSKKNFVEYGGLIVVDNETGRYLLTPPVSILQGNAEVDPYGALKYVPGGSTLVGEYHTHGEYAYEDVDHKIYRAMDKAEERSPPKSGARGFDSDNVSEYDSKGSHDFVDKAPGYRTYTGTPSGKIRTYGRPEGWGVLR
jgi:hypothetical protein